MDEINQVWSHWQTVEVIGQGGFGTVYKVKRETFDKVSYGAVKVIKIPNNQAEVDEMSTSGLNELSIKNYYKDMVYQLLDEIKMMENLKSASHIVSIEDYEIIENKNNIGWTIFIRMELLTNLNKYMKEHELDQNEVAKLGIHICKALEYCQKNNIVHRDIKPGNIFVSSFGEYKLGDFGISREVEHTNATLSQKGTKSYMAPEMIRMEKYGKSVDMYALGLTMYEILNHSRMPFLPPYPAPFYPKDREEAMLKRLTGEEFPPASLADDKMNYILNKACKADAKDRYHTATEMKEDLEAYIAGKPLPSLNGKEAVVASVVTPVVANEIYEEKTMVGNETIFDQMKNEEKTIIDSDERTMGMTSNVPLFEDVTIVKPKPIVEEEEKEVVIVPPPVPTPEPEKKKSKAGLIIAALLLIVAVVAGVIFLGGSEKEPPINDSDIVDTEQQRKEGIYNEAVELMSAASTKEEYEAVIEMLSEISDYKDAADLIQQCEDKIDEIEKAEDEKKKEENKPTTTPSSSSSSTSKPSSSSSSTSKPSSGSSSSTSKPAPVVKNWSDWTTSLPSNVTSDGYIIEEQVRYSYRDKQTTTSSSKVLSGWISNGSETVYGEYGPWTSWSTEVIGTLGREDTIKTETRTVTDTPAYTEYRYWRYKQSGSSKIHWCATLGKKYHGGSWYQDYTGWSTSRKSNAGSPGACSCHSGMGKYGPSNNLYYWEESRTVPAKTHTEYRYCERTKTVTYNYYRWTEWTDYSTTQVSSSSTREVRTQTYYRYKEK